MTHILLPYFILPLYSVMKGPAPNYMRAAASLVPGRSAPSSKFISAAMRWVSRRLPLGIHRGNRLLDYARSRRRRGHQMIS